MRCSTNRKIHGGEARNRPFSLRRAQLGFLALELVLVAGAVGGVLASQRQAWSDPWFVVAAVSPLVIVATAGLARLQRVLRATNEGLVVRSAFRTRVVSWGSIQAIHTSRSGSRRRIGVELEDGARIVVATGPLLARWSTIGRRIADQAPAGQPIPLAA